MQNIFRVRSIETGTNEALIHLEENTCAVNATDMCIFIQYASGLDNNKESLNLTDLITFGALKLVHLTAGTEYEFCLTITQNCNSTTRVVGWTINGSFFTRGKQ